MSNHFSVKVIATEHPDLRRPSKKSITRPAMKLALPSAWYCTSTPTPRSDALPRSHGQGASAAEEAFRQTSDPFIRLPSTVLPASMQRPCVLEGGRVSFLETHQLPSSFYLRLSTPRAWGKNKTKEATKRCKPIRGKPCQTKNGSHIKKAVATTHGRCFFRIRTPNKLRLSSWPSLPQKRILSLTHPILET